MHCVYLQPSVQEQILTSGTNHLHPLKMLLPSLLRSIATVMLFMGLFLTYATSFQMIRGMSLLINNLFSLSCIFAIPFPF